MGDATIQSWGEKLGATLRIYAPPVLSRRVAGATGSIERMVAALPPLAKGCTHLQDLEPTSCHTQGNGHCEYPLIVSSAA